MKTKSIQILMVLILLHFAVVTQAAIYIDGELYSGNTLDITDTSYNSPISVTENSVVNLYATPEEDWDFPEPSITLTQNAILNIYYEDSYVDDPGLYRPAVYFWANAMDNSVINFTHPQGYNFSIIWWHADDSGYTSLATYPGLQIDSSTRPAIANQSEIFRNYDSGVSHILTPIVADFELQDNAVMNFVPEPTTVFLFGIGGLLIRRRVQ